MSSQECELSCIRVLEVSIQPVSTICEIPFRTVLTVLHCSILILCVNAYSWMLLAQWIFGKYFFWSNSMKIVLGYGSMSQSYGVYSHFQQYFSYIVTVRFIGGRNKSTQGKVMTCCWYVTHNNIMLYWVHLVMIGTRTHNYHTFTTTTSLVTIGRVQTFKKYIYLQFYLQASSSYPFWMTVFIHVSYPFWTMPSFKHVNIATISTNWTKHNKCHASFVIWSFIYYVVYFMHNILLLYSKLLPKTRRVPLVEQEMVIFLQPLRSPALLMWYVMFNL
jgi:hypothetical protein